MDNETGRARLELYVESLRARMDTDQFTLLMRTFHAWLKQGGGTLRLHLEPHEKELFTAGVQDEMLTLMGLVGALDPGHEDRADHIVVDLGDGDHAKGVRSLVPRDIAEDPQRLAEMRRRLDAEVQQQRQQREQDAHEVESIARASGLLPENDDTAN
ncbi:hypothetical protein [Streptomyces gobiensis]|uniref:hypothetical protein n=1 Tax=Streptomyces gobiensis TaxID=2875706 RepID=UPI001E5C046B|nr:hypothetical protein [Streptomyces gobiensis]UGY90758.1 hypothetical protein test1122_02800 [Streptomyces gobiensis]